MLTTHKTTIFFLAVAYLLFPKIASADVGCGIIYTGTILIAIFFATLFSTLILCILLAKAKSKKYFGAIITIVLTTAAFVFIIFSNVVNLSDFELILFPLVMVIGVPLLLLKIGLLSTKDAKIYLKIILIIWMVAIILGYFVGSYNVQRCLDWHAG